MLQFAVGMFDHDAPSELLASNPSLYYVGSKATLYRGWSFWVNIVEALYVSLVVFFLAFGKDVTFSSFTFKQILSVQKSKKFKSLEAVE